MTTITTKQTEYPIVIFYSQKDNSYIADIPALKDCSAFGDTAQKALDEVLIAKELWLKTAQENNIPIPEVDSTKSFDSDETVSEPKNPKSVLSPKMKAALEYTLTNHKNVYMALKDC